MNYVTQTRRVCRIHSVLSGFWLCAQHASSLSLGVQARSACAITAGCQDCFVGFYGFFMDVVVE